MNVISDIFILHNFSFDEFNYDTYLNFIWKSIVDVYAIENIVFNGLYIIDNVIS